MKNWDLFVSGPELAIATIPRALNWEARKRRGKGRKGSVRTSADADRKRKQRVAAPPKDVGTADGPRFLL